MTFYSDDRRAIKVYHLLHVFFDVIKWGDEKSDLSYKDGLFLFDKKGLSLETSDNYLAEIYDALSQHYRPLSQWGTLSGVRPLKIVHLEREEGKTREEIYRGLLERDRISPLKADLLMEILDNQEEVYRSDRDKLSLYISLPFCPSICSYCCFHTKVYKRELAESYMDRLMEDLDYAKKELVRRAIQVDCIYLGGGTPWVLEMDQLTRLLDSLADFKGLKEFTFEGGRLDSLDQDKAELVARHASRVCLNPQSLSPGILPQLGRPQAEELKSWIHFFQSKGLLVASDLIAGLPGETLLSFCDSLEELISYGPENITIHNLSLKKGALLQELAPGDSVSSMLERGYETLKEAGYRPYYIYRQKNMVDRGENVGYERSGTAAIYNIRMMEDAHSILSLGSNAVSKKFSNGKLLRLTSPRDIHLYIKEASKANLLIDKFFE